MYLTTLLEPKVELTIISCTLGVDHRYLTPSIPAFVDGSVSSFVSTTIANAASSIDQLLVPRQH